MRVRVLQRKGHAALVEWQDEAGCLRRATVPARVLQGDEAEAGDLEMGIVYGLPWEELLGAPRVTPERIAAELRRHGIWTRADLRARPNVALAALQSAYGLDLAALMRAAEAYEKENENHG